MSQLGLLVTIEVVGSQLKYCGLLFYCSWILFLDFFL